MRALIVAESGALRSLMRDVLRAAGVQVLEAENVEKALDILRALGGCELGFIDWSLDGSGNLDLVRWIRGDRDFEFMRLVMVTPELHLEPVLKALKAGVDAYLLKPFSAETLKAKLRILGVTVEEKKK